MAADDESDLWPEFVYEIEQSDAEIQAEREMESDVERLNASAAGELRIVKQWRGNFEKELEPGQRLVIVKGLEIEMDEREKVYLIIEGLPVWRGELAEIRELHIYQHQQDASLLVLAVNQRIVWHRPATS
jgi:hypothetical protein